MTNRNIDTNGWFEVRENPISKSGVFPYLGKSIGAEDPDRVYMVYRPEEELNNDETIESFRLLPFVDEHAMLGAEYTPAEQKGIHGVIGEKINFSNGTLYANLKVFSESLRRLIDAGKRQVSAGFRCVYEFADGVFEGQPYQVIQRKIRGNHLALVPEGRMGKEVAVLDGAEMLDQIVFAFDAKEITAMDTEQTEGAMTLEKLAEIVTGLVQQVSELKDMQKKEDAAASDKYDEANVGGEIEKEEENKTGMDAAISALRSEVEALKSQGVKTMMGEIAKRDALAGKLSAHIGTFDHAEMTVADVAKYGVKKIGIACDAGDEVAALNGYLHGRQAPAEATVAKLTGMDSTEKRDPVGKFYSA